MEIAVSQRNLVEPNSYTQLPTYMATFIATGADSTVFRLEESEVVKFYYGELDKDPGDLVRFYAEVTNRAAEFLETSPNTGEINLAGVNYPYRIWVNPVIEIGRDSQRNRPFLVSRFIAGLSLQELEWYTSKTEEKVQPIQNESERNFFQELLEVRYGYKDRWRRKIPGQQVLQTNTNTMLRELNEQLEDQLQIDGIDIISNNIKIRRPQPDQLALIVTDLCTGFISQGLTSRIGALT